MLSQILLAAILLAVAGLMFFLNWRTQALSKDKGHVSDTWLAANRAANRSSE
jgi:hypothetical protein